MVYLDNAATTFPKPDVVVKKIEECLYSYAVNVGRGSYPLATQALAVVEETREQLGKMVNASNRERVVLTPSATIAANEVIMGLSWDSFKTAYVTPFEHNAIARPVNLACNKVGASIRMIPFNPNTQMWDEDGTRRLFEQDTPDYVFINHVSNVTGVILPVEEIAKLAKQYGACVVVDASQSLGLIDIDVQKSCIDYLIFAGHKNLYASFGIGGFIANAESINPIISGGNGSDSLNLFMPKGFPVGFEAGSPNVVAISGLNASVKWIEKIGRDNIKAKKQLLMEQLVSGLQMNKKVRLYLPEGNHTSVLSLNVEEYTPHEVGVILGEEYDIAVRTGFHCAPYIHDLIGTRERMGTVRISMSYFNSEGDVEAVISAINAL